MHEGHSLLPLSDIDFCFLRRTLSNHCDSESERHPEVIGAVVVVGIAVVVDIAGIGRIATIHGQKPPVGPERNCAVNNLCFYFFLSMSFTLSFQFLSFSSSFSIRFNRVSNLFQSTGRVVAR